MMLHMLWPSGPGIAIGGIGIAMDYWATVVRVGVTSKYLLFISPFSMSRVGNLSTTHLTVLIQRFLSVSVFGRNDSCAACCHESENRQIRL